MVDSDRSLIVDRAQVYDSFVQIISGSNRLRLKSLQSSEPNFNWPNLDRISDDGQLFLTPEISKSTYNQRMVLTTSEVDTLSTPTDIKTLSFFLFQKELRNSVQVEVSIVYTAKNAPSPNIMRLNFTYEMESFTAPRINEDGDVFVDTEGRILPGTITYIRASS